MNARGRYRMDADIRRLILAVCITVGIVCTLPSLLLQTMKNAAGKTATTTVSSHLSAGHVTELDDYSNRRVAEGNILETYARRSRSGPSITTTQSIPGKPWKYQKVPKHTEYVTEKVNGKYVKVPVQVQDRTIKVKEPKHLGKLKRKIKAIRARIRRTKNVEKRRMRREKKYGRTKQSDKLRKKNRKLLKKLRLRLRKLLRKLGKVVTKTIVKKKGRKTITKTIVKKKGRKTITKTIVITKTHTKPKNKKNKKNKKKKKNNKKKKNKKKKKNLVFFKNIFRKNHNGVRKPPPKKNQKNNKNKPKKGLFSGFFGRGKKKQHSKKKNKKYKKSKSKKNKNKKKGVFSGFFGGKGDKKKNKKSKGGWLGHYFVPKEPKVGTSLAGGARRLPPGTQTLSAGRRLPNIETLSAGRRSPGTTCPCRRKHRNSSSKCYFFTSKSGSYCASRRCKASYECVPENRRNRRGLRCVRRKVRDKIVSTGYNKCKVSKVDKFMYVPYY